MRITSEKTRKHRAKVDRAVTMFPQLVSVMWKLIDPDRKDDVTISRDLKEAYQLLAEAERPL